MKTISGALTTHLAGTVTTLATLWQIIRTDGEEFFFTDNDKDIVFSGDTYLAASGYKRTAVSTNIGLSVDNLDVQGVFEGTQITEVDIRAGLFDYAEVFMRVINWADTSQGVLKLKRGRLGEVSHTPQGFYQAELRGLSQLLSQTLLEPYTAECPADLGDTRCKIPIDPPVIQRSTAVALGEFYKVVTKSTTGVDWTDLGLNMGFEAQSPVSNTTTITGWNVLTGTWSIFATDQGTSADEGAVFLSGGNSASGSIDQIITLSDIGISTTEIDAGNATADFSIRRASQAGLDTGRVIVQYRDVDGVVLSTPLDTGSENISPNDVWQTRSFTGTALPANTRQIRIVLSYIRVAGGTAEAAFDDTILTVHDTTTTNTFQDIYENRIYEVTTAGTTAVSQPVYDTDVGDPTTDGTAVLTAVQAWTRHATIDDVTDQRTFSFNVTEARAVDGWFDQGGLVFESSDNSGKAIEIRTWTLSDATGIVFIPLPFTVLAGVKVKIYPGCDKRLATCRDKFDNVVNFRGFPFVPGDDAYRRFADVR